METDFNQALEFGYILSNGVTGLYKNKSDVRIYAYYLSDIVNINAVIQLRQLNILCKPL